jgi:F-type H+-transporting ATPase subunit epsilon
MPVELEIVSPEKLLLSRPVEMVVVPASEGDIGVLPGHTPMIVMLRGGMIEIYEGNRVTDRMFVDGGFCEITPERCTVLAPEVMPPSEVSRAAAEKRLAEAEAEFAALKNPEVAVEDAAQMRVQSARAMLAAAEAP